MQERLPLPEPPTPGTQEADILAMLLEARRFRLRPAVGEEFGPEGSITPGQIVDAGVYQYNARIHDLRKRGYIISCTLVPFETTSGRRGKVGCYRLEFEQ